MASALKSCNAGDTTCINAGAKKEHDSSKHGSTILNCRTTSDEKLNNDSDSYRKKEVEQGQLTPRTSARMRKITPANAPNISSLQKLSHIKQSTPKWEITEEEEEEEDE